ncbi:hypothetical protein K449DRAFT_470456 [Hypoxylon sp. EC38]|nr:hypothetical protein K449DRAFT_470456 [Hypoxylon sp. EC38]
MAFQPAPPLTLSLPPFPNFPTVVPGNFNQEAASITTAGIIGIVLGVVSLMATIALVVWWLWRRHDRKRRSPPDQVELQHRHRSGSSGYGRQEMSVTWRTKDKGKKVVVPQGARNMYLTMDVVHIQDTSLSIMSHGGTWSPN